MTTSSTNEYLKYVTLQLAAEAFIRDPLNPESLASSGLALINALIAGNKRASRFTPIQASEFADQWVVLDQCVNTGTGFSGTLFKAIRDNAALGIKKDELVISFRSTEFADDAVRDTQATNKLELTEFGWAFGQLADMEAWYREIKARYASDFAATSNRLAVTGYSLGGHLATAFNLMRTNETDDTGQPIPNPIIATYTFNGAGVGRTGSQQPLRDLVADFERQSKNLSGHEISFADAEARAVYEELRPVFGVGAAGLSAAYIKAESLRVEQMRTRSDSGSDPEPVYAISTYDDELGMLQRALERIASIVGEAERVNAGIPSGDAENPFAKPVAVSQIAATALDYQLAVLLAGQHTSAYRNSPALMGYDSVFGRCVAGPIGNFFDVFGSNLGWLDNLSAVANSQLHYGQSTPIFIEDQPLLRGNILADAGNASATYGEVKLLVPDFRHNTFGDTHSLILLVDSLSVLRVLALLDPAVSSDTLGAILTGAAKDKASWALGTQGRADGNSLEVVLNALATMLGMEVEPLHGPLEGGTWANPEQRARFYECLDAVTKTITDLDLDTQFTLSAAGERGLATQAKTDFSSFLSLYALSPFVLKTSDAAALAALERANPGLAQAWNADRNARLHGDTTKVFDFSDRWYSDRADMLATLNYRNQRNLASDALVPSRRALGDYSDLALAQTVSASPGRQTPSDYPPRIVFGGDADEALAGSLGQDRLYGGAGDDTLDGQGDNDYLEGGQGTDSYLFAGAFGQDKVVDVDGLGRIELDGMRIGNAVRALDRSNHWIAELDGGSKADLEVLKDGASHTGYSLRIRRAGETADTITLVGFNPVKAASSEGYLGIQLERSVLLYGGDPPTTTKPATPTPALAQALLQSFTAAGLGAADTEQTLTLKLSGAQELSSFKLVTGAETLDFASNGTVKITIAAGQDSIRLALVDTRDDGAATDKITLSATLTGSDGEAIPSNTMAIDFAGLTVPTEGTADRQIYGNFAPLRDADGGYQYDDLGNLLTDPTQAAPDTMATQYGHRFNAVLFGSTGDDLIVAGEGTLTIVEADAGNDRVRGGSGVDFLHGGSGDDVITGAGQSGAAPSPGLHEILLGGSGNNRIYADELQSLDLLLAGQKDRVASGQQGAFIGVGDGDNLIVGGDGHDVVFVGTGRNTVVMGAGDNSFVGGVNVDAVMGWWAASGGEFLGLQASSPGLDAPLEAYEGNRWNSLQTDVWSGVTHTISQGAGSGTAFGLGDATIFGGEGNEFYALSNGDNWLDAGGGDDRIAAGTGHNIIYGGAGNDTVLGGGGNNYINLEDGNDTLIARGGRQTIYGGVGNDIIYSGEQGSAWANSFSDARNYIDGGSGSDMLYGSGGNDTLISRSIRGQASTLHAGAGDDVLVGGHGADTLYGGTGSDTLIAGDGGNTVVLSKDAGANSTVYGGAGTDTIRGGAGTEVIYLGSGGTLSAPTQVYAGTGNTTIHGGSGAVQVHGGSGTTRFVAGSGEASITAGSGSNRYEFEPGFGHVELNMSQGGSHRIVFGSGIQPGDLTLSPGMSGDGDADLLITDGYGGSITVQQGLNRLEVEYGFADSGESLRGWELLQQGHWSDYQPMEADQAQGQYQAAHQASRTKNYVQQPDGSWYQAAALQGGWGWLDYTTGTQTFSTGVASSTVALEPRWSFVAGTQLKDVTLDYRFNHISATDPVTWVPASTTFAGQTSQAGLQVQWSESTTPRSTGYSQRGVWGYTYADGSVGVAYQQGAVATYGVLVNSSATYRSAVSPSSADLSASLLPYAPGLSLSGSGSVIPAVIPVDLVHQQITETFQTVDIAEGSHTVYGGDVVNVGDDDNVVDGARFVNDGAGNSSIRNATIVMDGAGDDTIVRARNVYDGLGNDHILNSTFVYGGAGDDLIDYADTVYFGAGNDIISNSWMVYDGDGDDLLVGNAQVVAGAGNNIILCSTEGGYQTDAITINPDTLGSAVIGGRNYYRQPTVYFGPGLRLADMRLSWGQVEIALKGVDYGSDGWVSGATSQPRSTYLTLTLDWGSGQRVQLVMPHPDDGYADPVDKIVFAEDGRTVGMAELIALAPPLPAFEFSSDMGEQTLPPGLHEIVFAPDIDPGEITVRGDAASGFVISYGPDASGKLLISPQAATTPVHASFADGSRWQFVNAQGNSFGYEAGDGVVHLIQASAVQFGAGITSDMITLGLGSLMLRVGEGGDVLHVDNFNAGDALGAANSIQSFSFADGTTLSYAQMLARGFEVWGTAGDDTLLGTNLDDRLYGGAGNDFLTSSAGAADTLVGGTGNDYLWAPGGHVTLVLNPGDGQDESWIAATAPLATVDFGTGIAMADFLVARKDTDLLVKYGDQGDSVFFRSFIASGQTNLAFRFVDGSVGQYQNVGGDIEVTVQVGARLVGRAWLESGGRFGNQVFHADGTASGISYDTDGGHSTFTQDAQGTLTSTRYDDEGRKLGTGVTRTDADGVATTVNFAADGSASGWSTEVTDAQGVVTTNRYDPQGQALGHEITTQDASGVLTTRRFDANGNLRGYQTVRVQWGGSVLTERFDGDGRWVGRTVWSALDGVSSKEVLSYEADGSSSYSWKSPYGSGMQLNAADGSGQRVWRTPDGAHGEDVWAADGSGSGEIYDADGSYLAYIQDASGDYTETKHDASGRVTGEAWWHADGSHGSDDFHADGSRSGEAYLPDGSVRRYVDDGQGSLTTWYYDAGSRLLHYSVAVDEGLGDTLTLDYDAQGLLLSEIRSHQNFAPLAAPIADQSLRQDEAFRFQLPVGTFTDANADPLSYSATRADGTPLPNWLGFDAASQTFSGTPGNGDVGALSLTVTAADTEGLSASAAFMVQVANVNDAPALTSHMSDTMAFQGSPLNLVLPADLFTDPDAIHGDVLTYRATLADGTPLPAWLACDASSGSLSGVPGLQDLGELQLLLLASDSAGLNASAAFTLTVAKLFTGTAAPDFIRGSEGLDYIDAGDGNDVVKAGGGNDTIVGGRGRDFLAGGDGDDRFLISGTDAAYDRFDGGDGFDAIVGSAGDDTIRVKEFGGIHAVELIDGAGGINVLAGTRQHDRLDLRATELRHIAVIDAGDGNDDITGSSGHDFMLGADGDDRMTGHDGNDVLQGGAGNDHLTGGAGNNLLDGGAGHDRLQAGAGHNLVLGGRGKDTVSLGEGSHVLVFNAGDGEDRVDAAPGSHSTLSLGGRMDYSELSLSRQKNDLILNVGDDDRITFENWYRGNRGIVTLQVLTEAMRDFAPDSDDALRNRRVQTYDFQAIVAAFDQTRERKHHKRGWTLTDALLDAHLAGSDTAALGGDLAYSYGTRGSLSGIDVASAQSTLSSADFASTPQNLNPWPALNTGAVQLR